MKDKMRMWCPCAIGRGYGRVQITGRQAVSLRGMMAKTKKKKTKGVSTYQNQQVSYSTSVHSWHALRQAVEAHEVVAQRWRKFTYM